MTIDWKKLKAKKTTVEPMMALIMGPSGAGKSSSLGTIGLSTLLLQGKIESHSGIAAKALAADKSLITSLDYTVNKPDGSLDAQASFLNLLEILKDASLPEHFQAVAIDGASELQLIMKDTAKFKQLCLNERGGHNSFKEAEAYSSLFNDVITLLLNLRAKGLHCFMTCAAIVTGGNENSDEITAKPNLFGFTVAENLCRNFGDLFYVSMCKEEDESKNENTVHRFIFNPKVSATSKDKHGKIIKQSFSNFSPRISYFTRDELPEKSEVNFVNIIKARQEKGLK